MEEIFLPPLITALKNKAAELVHGEFPAAGDVQTECQELYQQLLQLEAVVEDAEERRRTDTAVDAWVDSVKFRARVADEILDTLKYETIGIVHPDNTTPNFLIRIGGELRMLTKRFDSILIEMSKFGFKRSQQVVPRPLTKRFDSILIEMNKFRFKRSQQVVPRVVDWPLTYKVDSTVIGRDDDLNKILGIVLGQDEMKEEVVVLPIVGKSGIGKTTLAQLIYNNGNIQKHFDHRLWVCVNDEFDVVRLVKSITDLVILDSRPDNIDLLFQTLRAELDGTRFLLVLDDVWNKDSDKWMQLKHLLDCGGPGSVVIVTTCRPEVASIVGTVHSYYLSELKDENLWEIFRLRAFGMGVEQQPVLAKIGMDILMKNCYGSPLVAKTLGVFMSYKKGEKEWLDVLKGSYKKEVRGWDWWDVWRVVSYKELDPTYVHAIFSVLKFCYDDLPSHMKWCLAFCAIYPRNYEMERDTLIQLWMANSYIPPEKNMEIEEKGVEIFNELVWRGFFQDVKEKDNGVVCKMHYLIHVLVQSLVGREFTSSSITDQHFYYWRPIIHLSSFNEIDFNLDSRFLRTFLLLPHGFRKDQITFSMKFRGSLKALSLTELLCRKIDVNPIENRHLRYLDLSYCTDLEVLPESFSTLYCLQTLKLSQCIQLQCLPKDMSSMRSLRHVYLDGCYQLKVLPENFSTLSCLQTLKLSQCIQLQCLPKDMSSMCSLRHVYLDGCYQLKHMPAGLGKLRHLQTLTMYLVNPDIGCGIGELKDLNLGGKLELYGLCNLENIEDAKQANLVSKRKLFQLCFSWGSVQSSLTEFDDSNAVKSNPDTDKDILEGLKPNENLEVLEIRQYRGTLFSTWMNDCKALSNLTELILIDCTQCVSLPPICEIGPLKKLILVRLYSLKYVCSDGSSVSQGVDGVLHKFAKLEHLTLVDMPNLESWLENDLEEQTSLFLSKRPERSLEEVYKTLQSLTLDSISSGSLPQIETERTSLGFPKLHELTIVHCPKLDTLPYLPSCPFLRVLEIAGEVNIPFSLLESLQNKGVLVIYEGEVLASNGEEGCWQVS